MEIMSQVTILAMIALVGAGFLLLTGAIKLPSRSNNGGGGNRNNNNRYHNNDHSGNNNRYGTQIDDFDGFDEAPKPIVDLGTIMPPILFIDQLHPRSKALIQRFEVKEIPVTGITISRPNAKEGTIKLNNSVDVAFTVSEKHVRIGMDEQGMFIQDQKDTHRMRLAQTKEIIDEVDITDGLTLYVGQQPLRFVIPKFEDLFENDVSDGGTCEYRGNGTHGNAGGYKQQQAFGRRKAR